MPSNLAIIWQGILLISCHMIEANKSDEEPDQLTSAAFLQTVLDEQSYDNRIYPGSLRQTTTDVNVHLVIESIDSVDETSMDFTSTFTLTQEWYDRRLRFHNLIPKSTIELDSKMIHSVWVPDLYFANEKTALLHRITVPNIMMHIRSNGFIRYKTRVSLAAACPMNLQKFPMDTQKCSLLIKSFAYTRRTVNFTWREDNPVVSRTFELPQFRLVNVVSGKCDNGSYIVDEGDFSCIQADFYLERQIGYYMTQLYIPSVLIVSLSWVSFWLTIEAVPARISLGILTVLTMTTQKSSVGVSLPRVSYVKAIDVWMAICMVFVFAALLEFALVNVLSRREKKRSKENKHQNEKDSSHFEPRFETKRGHKGAYLLSPCRIMETSGFRRARTLDKVSRIFFPVSYVLFCSIYWAYYTQI